MKGEEERMKRDKAGSEEPACSTRLILCVIYSLADKMNEQSN